MRLSSRISKNYGDEPANGKKGVVSSANQGMAAPVTSSSIVRINGSWAIRHGDRFEMDKASVDGPGNTIGEGRLVRDTQPREAPKGALQSFAEQFMDKSQTAKDVAGVWDKTGQYWNDPSQIGRDAQAAYESLPSWQGVKDGAQTLAQGAADKASQIYDDPAGQARQGAQATKDYLSGLWGSTKNIYSASGVPGVAGAALGVIGDFVSPSKKLRMVKEGAEVVHDLEKAKKLEQAVESTENAVRVTRPKQVHHFATNKNKKFTPDMEEVAKKYGLDLDGDWNKEVLDHLGRHPDKYHDFVLESMREADRIAQGKQSVFLQQFEQLVKEPVRQNPDLLRKSGW